MPARHATKQYISEGYYHLYNRGVEKRIIFENEQDYAVLLSYLKQYLLIKDEDFLRGRLADPTISYKEKEALIKQLRLNNFSTSIDLLAYCLMPNHFHILVKQHEENAIDSFMNSLWTRYTQYFNKKYKRIGSLFADVYKAVLIKTDEQLLYLSRYIHRNPIAKRHYRNPTSQGDALRGYNFSSYLEYLNLRHTEWIKPTEITQFFSNNYRFSYQLFVEDSQHDEIMVPTISPIIIED